jgi:GTP pyrophosphokinase
VTSRDGIATMRFLFELGNMGLLDTLLQDVKGVEGVFDAHRMAPGMSPGGQRMGR